MNIFYVKIISSINIIYILFRDPYEQRYVFVKESLVPFAGEGLFAKQKIKVIIIR